MKTKKVIVDVALTLEVPADTETAQITLNIPPGQKIVINDYANSIDVPCTILSYETTNCESVG